MDQISFIFTLQFMLLGPIKLIPSFAGVTRGADVAFKRSVAIRAVVIAAALCLFVVLLGGTLVGKYHISINAVRIGGGLVLLISALQVIFQKAPAPRPAATAAPALQVAASPVAVPHIVPPAGVAVLLLMIIAAPQYPGMLQAVLVSLAIVMVLDLLVMYFIDAVLKTPGLALVLTMLGSVLVFVQVCLAIQMVLVALTELRVLQG